MLSIAICDDSKESRDTIKTYVEKFFAEKAYIYKLSEFASGEELLADETSDIVLLDVEMAGIDGVEVKNKLKYDSKTRIIFVTSHSEVMAEAFGANVIGFLTKPIDYKMLSGKLEEAVAGYSRDSRYITIESSGNVYKAEKILLMDIVYIKSDDRYTEIIVNDGRQIFSDKGIGSYEQELKEDFGLASRSCLVNFRYVKAIDKNIKLKTEESVSLSRRRVKAFKEQYREYVKRQVFI